MLTDFWDAANDAIPYIFMEIAWEYGATIQAMSLSWDKYEVTLLVFDGDTHKVILPLDDISAMANLLHMKLKFIC